MTFCKAHKYTMRTSVEGAHFCFHSVESAHVSLGDAPLAYAKGFSREYIFHVVFKFRFEGCEMIRSKNFAVALACAASLIAVPQASAIELNPDAVPGRTQITLRLSNGAVMATNNASESRPALSLSKLYLGYWVLKNGAPEHKAEVEDMIRYSDDAVASKLERIYPQAIPEVIETFGLTQTHHNGFWGNTTTSTNDVTLFLERTRNDPAAQPMFRGMRTAAPVARDGYLQNYGTATLPGVEGTKFGWSDDHSVNATASFGPGFSIAANTYGSPAQLTDDVQAGVRATNQSVALDDSTSVPAVSAVDIREQLSCVNLDFLPDNTLIPAGVAEALPRC